MSILLPNSDELLTEVEQRTEFFSVSRSISVSQISRFFKEIQL